MGLTDEQILSALKIVLQKVKGKGITWRLNGSCNLRVMGMDVAVRDIDVSADQPGAEAFKQALAEYLDKDRYDNSIDCRVLLFIIDGCEFEICVYKDARAMYNKIAKVRWKGMNLPVLPLKHAKEFYNLVGRPEKAEMIDRHINASKTGA